MNAEIGAEDALFPEKEYVSGIFVAVWNWVASDYLLSSNTGLSIPQSLELNNYCLLIQPLQPLL